MNNDLKTNFDELSPLCTAVAEQHGPEAVVVLFGSRAFGDAGEFSDYDLLVLANFPDDTPRGIPFRAALKGLDRDLLCLKPEEFEQRLEAWVTGEEAPALNGIDGIDGMVPSRADLGMCMSALDGTCLLGEAPFARFRERRTTWVQEGRIPCPSLQRLVSIEDGLTHVQRSLMAALTNKPQKSARVVFDAVEENDSLGESHAYQTLIRMAQPFVSRYPLVRGQGNFGSLSGHPCAAMRYTECRASRFLQFGRDATDQLSAKKLRSASSALRKLTKKAADESVSTRKVRRAVSKSTQGKKKNQCLPIVFPHLLANGTLGLPRVDTKIPPFALSKVVAALRQAIQNDDASDAQLLQAIGLPDFPTGGILTNADDVRSGLKKGQGLIRLKARLELTCTPDGKQPVILIRELPFGRTGDVLEGDLVEAGKQGTLAGVKKARDTTSLQNGFGIELTVSPQTAMVEIHQALMRLPSMTSELPFDITVAQNGAPVRLSLPDLIRHEAKRFANVFGSTKAACRALNELAEFEPEPRRTHISAH